jgi:hypothetical protein
MDDRAGRRFPDCGDDVFWFPDIALEGHEVLA